MDESRRIIRNSLILWNKGAEGRLKYGAWQKKILPAEDNSRGRVPVRTLSVLTHRTGGRRPGVARSAGRPTAAARRQGPRCPPGRRASARPVAVPRAAPRPEQPCRLAYFTIDASPGGDTVERSWKRRVDFRQRAPGPTPCARLGRRDRRGPDREGERPPGSRATAPGGRLSVSTSGQWVRAATPCGDGRPIPRGQPP
jgi:hypothetical protein